MFKTKLKHYLTIIKSFNLCNFGFCNNFNFTKMKKVILTILLVSAICSCEKKENPIIDNTKSLQKIDSLMRLNQLY